MWSKEGGKGVKGEWEEQMRGSVSFRGKRSRASVTPMSRVIVQPWHRHSTECSLAAHSPKTHVSRNTPSHPLPPPLYLPCLSFLGLRPCSVHTAVYPTFPLSMNWWLVSTCFNPQIIYFCSPLATFYPQKQYYIGMFSPGPFQKTHSSFIIDTSILFSMKPYLISQSQAVLSLLRPPVLGGHTAIIALILLCHAFLSTGLGILLHINSQGQELPYLPWLSTHFSP